MGMQKNIFVVLSHSLLFKLTQLWWLLLLRNPEMWKKVHCDLSHNTGFFVATVTKFCLCQKFVSQFWHLAFFLRIAIWNCNSDFFLRIAWHKLTIASNKVQFWGGKKTDVLRIASLYLTILTELAIAIKRKKLQLWDTNSQFWEKKFISRNSDFMSQNYNFIS